jgi:tetratricopeptide (TPR) repeat protein
VKTADFLLIASLVFASAVPVRACAWDSDTLRDEAVQKGSVYDFITGQFPHHGEGYYRERVRRLMAKPALDFTGKNDLAVAYIRLEQWKDAEALLLANLKEKPDDYFTMSNLGVLEKKRGNYAVSADWIAKALTIKPEGHLGLGDWYLRDLKFRLAAESDPRTKPLKNFLGEDYSATFAPLVQRESAEKGIPHPPDHFERLQRLLENDQTFADGLLVMGDHLANKGDLNLAFLCYKRALLLGHPNPLVIKIRVDRLYRHFHEETISGRGGMEKLRRDYEAKASRVFAEAAGWLANFKKTEAELVAKKGDAVTEPSIVEAELERRGIKRPRP